MAANHLQTQKITATTHNIPTYHTKICVYVIEQYVCLQIKKKKPHTHTSHLCVKKNNKNSKSLRRSRTKKKKKKNKKKQGAEANLTRAPTGIFWWAHQFTCLAQETTKWGEKTRFCVVSHTSPDKPRPCGYFP